MITTFDRISGSATPAEFGSQQGPGTDHALTHATPQPTERNPVLARLSTAFTVLLCVGPGAWCWLYCRNRKQSISKTETAALQSLDREVNRDAIFAKRQDMLQKLSQILPAVITGQVCISDLMTRQLVKVLPHTSAHGVRKLMKEKHVRHLLVCTAEGELEGIISVKDAQRNGATTAAAMMTRDVLTIEPHSLLDPTITQLLHNQISCLPVVKDRLLLGIFTTTDALMTLQCISQLGKKLVSEQNACSS